MVDKVNDESKDDKENNNKLKNYLMSSKSSTIIFTSSNNNSSVSSSNSSNSAIKIGDLVNEFDQTSIHSCVIGISKIDGYKYTRQCVHTALLLTDKKSREFVKKGGKGILIEYGNYSPNVNDVEKNYVKEGYVIYRYGEKGGLRYYAHYFDKFIDTFSDVGYIPLDIDKDNQISFSYLLDKIAPKNENNWIQKNYNSIGIFGQTLNCQTFTAHALDIMKPEYDPRLISKGKETVCEFDKDKESIIPDNVLKILKKYEDD
jgi:hypothetical protein